MIQYVDKAVVETELQRRLKSYKEEIEKYSPFQHNLVIDIIGKKEECKDILSFLDTLEVKEVDLEKEIELIKGDYEQVDVAWNNDFDFIAKHFFELGLSVSNKAMKGE